MYNLNIIARLKATFGMFCTIEQMAQKIYKRTGPEERNYLRTLQKSDMIDFHSTIGRQIRNEFQLWDHRNPLTKAYYDDGDKYIKDGVNHHPDHPDEVSMKVLERVWEIANTRTIIERNKK